MSISSTSLLSALAKASPTRRTHAPSSAALAPQSRSAASAPGPPALVAMWWGPAQAAS